MFKGQTVPDDVEEIRIQIVLQDKNIQDGLKEKNLVQVTISIELSPLPPGFGKINSESQRRCFLKLCQTGQNE